MRISDWSSDVCSSDLDAIVTDEAQPAWRLPEPKIGVGKRRGRDRKISEPGTYNVEGFRVRSEPAQCRERGVAFTFQHKITRWRRVHLHRQHGSMPLDFET